LSEVAAVILVDDVEISISRILKENWVKTWIKTTEFSGNVGICGMEFQCSKTFQEK
jgi:hypothetical protein